MFNNVIIISTKNCSNLFVVIVVSFDILYSIGLFTLIYLIIFASHVHLFVSFLSDPTSRIFLFLHYIINTEDKVFLLLSISVAAAAAAGWAGSGRAGEVSL